MNVVIEAQYLCLKQEQVRGIPNYIRAILMALSKRKANSYSISFYDYNRERGNRDLLLNNLPNEIIDSINILECNDRSYKDYIDAYVYGDKGVLFDGSYEDYLGCAPDLVHFPTSFCVPQNVKSVKVVTVHDIMPVLPQFSSNWDERSLKIFRGSLEYLKNDKSITVISDSLNTKKDLIERAEIEEERIFVVPLAFDSSLHYPEKKESVLTDLGINKKYILYLGALDPRKGIGDIIDTYEIIRKSHDDLYLVLAGNVEKNYKDELEEKIKSCMFFDDIVMTGYVDEQQKRSLLSGAELFVFPSEYEGFGLPILEAMACGAPVITTRVSSIPEVGADAVEYVQPGDVEELAGKIEKVLNTKELQENLRRKGIERSKLFSWERTAEMTEEVYRIAYERR